MDGGALTQSFIQAMQNEPGLTYGHLLHSMRSIILDAKQQLGLNTHQQQYHMNHRLHYAHVCIFLSTTTYTVYFLQYLSQIMDTSSCS